MSDPQVDQVWQVGRAELTVLSVDASRMTANVKSQLGDCFSVAWQWLDEFGVLLSEEGNG